MLKKGSILIVFICSLIMTMPAFAREGLDIRSLIPTEQEAAQGRKAPARMEARGESEYESPATRAKANRADEARETRPQRSARAREEGNLRHENVDRAVRARETNRAERYQDNAPPRSSRAQRSGAIIYSGNTDTLKFHHPDCRYYYCKACTRTFNSRQEAIRAGYSECQICGGQ